jgi:molybdenum cofactor guanylyltransferase
VYVPPSVWVMSTNVPLGIIVGVPCGICTTSQSRVSSTDVGLSINDLGAVRCTVRSTTPTYLRHAAVDKEFPHTPWPHESSPAKHAVDGSPCARQKSRAVKRASKSHRASPPRPSIEICILAGGLSTRMGRDKSRVAFKGRTLLAHVRLMASKLEKPVRVIRRDLVPRCGPLGGVFTALTKSRADSVLFLACDMPFVSAGLLHELETRLSPKRQAIFAVLDGVAGFPFIVRRQALAVVEQQIARKEFSLQKLAAALDARLWTIPKRRQEELRNLNSPGDLRAVRSITGRWRLDHSRQTANALRHRCC